MSTFFESCQFVAQRQNDVRQNDDATIRQLLQQLSLCDNLTQKKLIRAKLRRMNYYISRQNVVRKNDVSHNVVSQIVANTNDTYDIV